MSMYSAALEYVISPLNTLNLSLKLEFHPITDTRHDGQQGDLLPFLRFCVVGDEEGIVAVREVVDAQIQPMLRAGGGLFQIKASIPAEEGGHAVIVHARIKIDSEFFPCQ